MATYTSIPEVIASYQERFIPDGAAGVDGVVQLNLTGDGGGMFYMIIKDKHLTIEEGTYEEPTVTVTASAEDWLKVNNGAANPMTMMMMGKIKLKGPLPLATKVQTMFRAP